MTCIVGIEHNNKVYIGGDSYAVGSNNVYEVLNPKVFKNGEFIFGYTSTFRFGQVLETMELPKLPKNKKDYYKFLIKEVTPEIKKALGDDEIGMCLVGVGSQLYIHQSDSSILRPFDGYGSVGCGREYALASMETQLVLSSTRKPKKLIKTSLEVTSKHCHNVGGKITIINT